MFCLDGRMDVLTLSGRLRTVYNAKVYSLKGGNRALAALSGVRCSVPVTHLLKTEAIFQGKGATEERFVCHFTGHL